MPREIKCVGELIDAIKANRVRDVRNIFENKIKRKDRLAFLCMGDSDQGKSSKSKDRDCETAILAATKLEDSTILKYFIENGADVNFMSESASGKKTGPLHTAINHGLYNNVNTLLEANADVNKVDHFNRTPLHIAVKAADIEATRMLLSRGAKVNVCDKDGYVPLQIAAKYGHMELVRVLLDHHADIFQRGQAGPSPLHIASLEGHVNVLDVLACRVDVNIKVDCLRYGKQRAALHLASERGYFECVQLLVQKFGADVNVKDENDQLPLHAVVSSRHDCRRMRQKANFDMVAELLIHKGSRVNEKNKKGNTPLHLAARNHYHQVVTLLLGAGADTTLQNNDGKLAKDMIPDYDLQMKQLFHRVAQGNIMVTKVQCGEPSNFAFSQQFSPVLGPKQSYGSPTMAVHRFPHFTRSSLDSQERSSLEINVPETLIAGSGNHLLMNTAQLQGTSNIVFHNMPLMPTAPSIPGSPSRI